MDRVLFRLRDFACTKDDWDWWREHDLDRGHLNEEQRAYFDNEAVWLCVQCEDVGRCNEEYLLKMKDENLMIHKIEAEHSRYKNARKEPSKVFDGLRSVVHVLRGCT